jgi:hypothetical protein
MKGYLFRSSNASHKHKLRASYALIAPNLGFRLLTSSYTSYIERNQPRSKSHNDSRLLIHLHYRMLPSIYAQNLAVAANSPRKKSALLGYDPSAVYTIDTKPEHPAKKWLSPHHSRSMPASLRASPRPSCTSRNQRGSRPSAEPPRHHPLPRPR